MAVARYHVGLCQSMLGDSAGATKTLEEASHTSDPEIAALRETKEESGLDVELIKTKIRPGEEPPTEETPQEPTPVAPVGVN